MDLAEITGAFRSGITFPAMVVESPEGDLNGSSIHNSVIQRTGAFTVYKKPTKGNFQQQNEYLDDCEKLGLKIVARMRLDNANPDHAMYQRFDIPGISWIKVGPIFNENLYGYRFTYPIKGSEPLTVNPADWQDLDSVCG